MNAYFFGNGVHKKCTRKGGKITEQELIELTRIILVDMKKEAVAAASEERNEEHENTHTLQHPTKQE